MTAVGQRPTALTLEHRSGDTGWAVAVTYSGATPIAPVAELTDPYGNSVPGAALAAALAGQVVTLTVTGTVPLGRHRWRLHDSGLTHLAGEFVSTDQPRPDAGTSAVTVEVVTGAAVTVEVAAAFSGGGGGGGSMTATEILTAIKTVDGAGSGLDADLLDGQHAAAFAAAAHSHSADSIGEVIRDTMASALVAGANVTITPNDGADTITITASGGGGGSPALPELQTPEELWDGTASETWLIPAFAGTLAAATNEWPGGPFTFAPFYIYESITVDRVRITVPTAAAGSTVRLAAYAATSGGWPTGAALHDFGTIDTSTAGTKVLSGSWAFTSGRFWVAIWYSSQSVSIVCGNPSYDVLAGVPISAYDASGTQVRTPWPRPTTAFHATNAFPTLGGASPQTSGTNGSAIVPFVSLRRSA